MIRIFMTRDGRFIPLSRWDRICLWLGWTDIDNLNLKYKKEG